MYIYILLNIYTNIHAHTHSLRLHDHQLDNKLNKNIT